ncbi:patched domain-containing protein 1-like isoform X1 [Clavelina lepadiformis]|uniref:patched domain-containing protein 1-like isoform X1 n=1 Tax=Clavelina lepadiformis TaxID=159417 RepID=UPI0040415B13
MQNRESFQTCRFFRIYKYIQVIGSAIHGHSIFFVVIPVLLAIVFGLVMLANTGRSREVHQVNVKDMFISPNENVEKIREFDKEWFGDTWASVGSSRHCGYLLIRTRQVVDIFTEDALSVVLKLHDVAINIRVEDPTNGNTITYEEVCQRVPPTLGRNETSSYCLTDPLMDLLLCSIAVPSHKVVLKVEEKTQTLEALLSPISSYSNSNDLTGSGSSSRCLKMDNRRVSLGLSVGLIDKDALHTLSARALRTFFLLRDATKNERRKARLWLYKFEDIFSSLDERDVILYPFTTQSVNKAWLQNISFGVYHAIVLCSIDFLLILVYVNWLNTLCFGAYLGACGAVSLTMSLLSTYTIHLLMYGTLDFNFVLCALFITIVNGLFQSSYAKRYLYNETCSACDEPDCDETFVQTYQEIFLFCIALTFIFAGSFAMTAIPFSLSSLRNMCVMSCIGFTLTFLYQVTFFPACIRLYEVKLSELTFKCCTKLGVSHGNRRLRRAPKLMSVRIVEQQGSNSRRVHRNVSASKLTNLKRKMRDWIDAYIENVTANCIRPIGVIILLTYISFSYVGCVHFTEQISMSQLLSMDSAAYKYLKGEENYFDTVGCRFVVMGKFAGNPWDKNVREEFFEIHDKLIQVEAVDNILSRNWFLAYIQSFQSETAQYLSGKSSEAVGIYEDDYSPADEGYSASTESEEMDIRTDKELPSLMSMPEDKDWKTLWENFTQSDEFKHYYARDINYSSESHYAEGDGNAKKGFTGFRWIYHMRHASFTDERLQLLLTISELLKETNFSTINSLYIDAPEFDWWKSIKAGEFNKPMIYLLIFSVVTIFAAVAILKSALVVFWCAATGTSVSFGITGMLSYCGIGLDSFTIVCIVFSFSFSVGVVSDMIFLFVAGKNGGRALWANIALRRCGQQATFCFLLVLVCSLILAYQASYMSRGPLVALMISTFFTAGHVFLFLPVLLTVFPPSKKITRGLSNVTAEEPINDKQVHSTGISMDSKSRPHLHARRYFYDFQRASSFRSDEEDARIEQHVTCL